MSDDIEFPPQLEEKLPLPGLNVLILHIGRCGSTVLADMLNQHSHICSDSEIFTHGPKYYAKRFPDGNLLDFMFRRVQWGRVSMDNPKNLTDSEKIYTCEFKYLTGQHSRFFRPRQQPHVNNSVTNPIRERLWCILSKEKRYIGLHAFLQAARKIGFTHFIILHRKNLLRRHLSMRIAQHRNSYQLRSGEKWEKEPIYLSFLYTNGHTTHWLSRGISFVEEEHTHLCEVLQASNVLHLTYEEDIEPDPFIAYRKTCQFLGVEEEAVTINVHQVNPYPIESVIKNYRMLRFSLAFSRHRWMLDSGKANKGPGSEGRENQVES